MHDRILVAATIFSALMAVLVGGFIIKSIIDTKDDFGSMLEQNKLYYRVDCGQIGSDYTKEKPKVINGMYEYVSLDNYHHTASVVRCKLRSPKLVPTNVN